MASDLATPDEILPAFVRARASIDPVDVCTWFRGTLRSCGADESVVAFGAQLFTVEGCSVARALAVEGGFDVLAREAVLFRDCVTNAIVDHWTNPWTGEDVEVLHGWSDPAHERYRMTSADPIPRVESIGDDLAFVVERFDTVANPLAPSRWPKESSGTSLGTSSFTQTLTSRRALDAKVASVPSKTTITRLMPWLPWMLMGGYPAAVAGSLVMNAVGSKVGPAAGLPGELRRSIEARRPEFLFAPTSTSGPNETPWTLYSKERRPVR